MHLGSLVWICNGAINRVQEPCVFGSGKGHRGRLIIFDLRQFRNLGKPLGLVAVAKEGTEAFTHFGAGIGRGVQRGPSGANPVSNSLVRARTVYISFPSQKVRRRANSRVYLLITFSVRPWFFLSWIKRSIQAWSSWVSFSGSGAGVRPASWFSKSRFFSSASA